jgi:hypoxanthine phosphoribosyltransferase
MPATIQVHDKYFEILLEQTQIEERIATMALQIAKDYEGKNPIFLAILNGSFMFAAQLLKTMPIPCEITFVRVASYKNTTSTGQVTEVLGLQENLQGRDVIVLEDIIDTGVTMSQILPQLKAQAPDSLEVVSLFQKPEALKCPLNVKYLGFPIANRFIIGYGLDYNGLGRNLGDLYVLKEE